MSNRPSENQLGLEHPGPITVTASAWHALEKYVCAKIELERSGGISKRQLEEVRSYAVEAVHSLFYDNPALCSYRRRMDAVLEQRKTP